MIITNPRRMGSSAVDRGLGWPDIVRLGIVQAMIGAVVVLTTSTLNRVLVVELALPALVPGLLVGWHYAVQLTRPRMGFGSDQGARRTPWIVGGMAVLALGGWLAALITASTADGPTGLSQAVALPLLLLAFTLVGLGVSAAGTSLLALLATRVAAPRRASAAATVWVMMIMGFAVTAGTAGRFLDPYSPQRLVTVSGVVSLLALLVTLLALWRLEGRALGAGDASATTTVADASAAATQVQTQGSANFRTALAEVWREPDARRFTIFVFVSMVAYSAQDLILEPFAGHSFGYTPGESTQLSGVQHGGTLVGMLLAALAGRRLFGVGFGSLRTWTSWGCVASCVALAGLAYVGFSGATVAATWPLRANVFLMGVANGAFSIAAIGSMMALAGGGSHGARTGREGTRMGLWGAAQAIGFAGGGVIGTAASDVARWLLGSPGPAYASVFAAEALLFVAAAWLARHIAVPDQPSVASESLAVMAGATPAREAA